MIKLTPFNPGPAPNSIAGSATTKLLYGSDMDDLTIMLRESVQNSWDARNSSKEIKYSFTGLVLSDEELSNLRICIGDSPYGKKISDFINNNDKCAIQITDIGTSGLIGDVNYDNNHSDLSRFLKFVFEVGNSKQGSGSGGSFGYGKASLYKVSKVGTVAIYSRIKSGLDYEERFIIKSINRFEDEGEDTSSGVYWWGDHVHTPSNESCARSIVPVIGPQASQVAESLGMKTLKGTETGTVLMVYEPFLDINPDEVDNETHGFPSLYSKEYDKLKDVVVLMQRASVHYFWAKYSRKSKGIDFEFSLRNIDGEFEIIESVHPKNITPYNQLLECLDLAKRPVSEISDSEKCRIVSSTRPTPTTQIGLLAWVELSARNINPMYINFFKSNSSYVALMRNIEFVVRYMEVDIDLPEGVDGEEKFIMGVFRTLQNIQVSPHKDSSKKVDLEEVFRAAENQTHGEWQHNNVREMGKWCVSYVKQTPDKIVAALKDVYPDIQRGDISDYGTLDADNMTFLGQFITGIQGGGKPGEKLKREAGGGGSGGNSKPKPTLDYIRNDGVTRNGDMIQSLHVFKLRNPDVHKPVRLYAVCPNEDGEMTIRATENATLPVSITSLKVLDNASSRVDAYVNKNGTLTLNSKMTEYTVCIYTEAVTDCRYGVGIESMEIIK